MPRLPARAHAGLLAEGASQPAEVLRRGGVPRQADPKPHLPESDAPRGTEVRLAEGEGAVECHSGTSWWARGQRSECGRETKECGAASCVIDSCLHEQVHIPKTPNEAVSSRLSTSSFSGGKSDTRRRRRRRMEISVR